MLLKLAKTKLGDIKKLAKKIKTAHDLALELWSTGHYYPRLLAILILDKKPLSKNTIDQLAADILGHSDDECKLLADWLLANQLMTNKQTVCLLETWEKHPSVIQRRLFWYYQARLRWTGQETPKNSEALLDSLERDMADAEPYVQWAMNFCAGQIGIHQSKFRTRCIRLSKSIGLYKDEDVAKNCTP